VDAEDRAHHLASARKTGQKQEKGLSFRGHHTELRKIKYGVPGTMAPELWPGTTADTRFGSDKVAVGEHEVLQSRGRVPGESR